MIHLYKCSIYLSCSIIKNRTFHSLLLYKNIFKIYIPFSSTIYFIRLFHSFINLYESNYNITLIRDTIFFWMSFVELVEQFLFQTQFFPRIIHSRYKIAGERLVSHPWLATMYSASLVIILAIFHQSEDATGQTCLRLSRDDVSFGNG